MLLLLVSKMEIISSYMIKISVLEIGLNTWCVAFKRYSKGTLSIYQVFFHFDVFSIFIFSNIPNDEYVAELLIKSAHLATSMLYL